MRNFWVGVLTGVLATVLLSALFVLFAAQRARADGLSGNVMQPYFIRTLIEHHGEYGTIEQIDEQSITIVEHDGGKQRLSVGTDTEIYRGRTKIALSDLISGQHVIVIAGQQPDGTLKAKLIRVMGASLLFTGLKPGEG